MEFNNQSEFNLTDQFFTLEGLLQDDDPVVAASEYLQDPPYAPVEIDVLAGSSTLHEEPSSSKQ